MMKILKTIILVAVMLLTIPLQAADVVVKGVVTDGEGEPLIGVTVQQKGTQRKTITNIEGRYVLTADGPLPVTLVYKIGRAHV